MNNKKPYVRSNETISSRQPKLPVINTLPVEEASYAQYAGFFDSTITEKQVKPILVSWMIAAQQDRMTARPIVGIPSVARIILKRARRQFIDGKTISARQAVEQSAADVTSVYMKPKWASASVNSLRMALNLA